MSDFAQTLERHSHLFPALGEAVEYQKILGDKELTLIGKGTFFRVYKVKDEPWVVKEGRWDLDMKINQDLQIKLPAGFIQSIGRTFDYTFRPTVEETIRQYEQYQTLALYFGYFNQKLPNRRIKDQTRKRQQLQEMLPVLIKKYKLQTGLNILNQLVSDFKDYNFLPLEYLFYSQSIDPANRGRDTVYIVQEWMEGITMNKLDPEETTETTKKQLQFFTLLTLFMHYQEQKLPDTRPSNPIKQFPQWLRKSSNFMVTNDGLKFIDTRWLWETNSNFLRRGLFIPELIIRECRKVINET